MNTAAIFHSATIPWSYPINENQLMIRLQTDVDVEKVFLRWGDRRRNSWRKLGLDRYKNRNNPHTTNRHHTSVEHYY